VRRSLEADPPEGVGERKFDASAAAIVALLKCGSGVLFWRLAGLEASLGIPLPPDTDEMVLAHRIRTSAR
jgi:hypothetical protein